jgi:hypothetical protein
MKRSKNYRKIWENYTGLKIPKGYHVHHKDGDRTNDNPENLICVSPEEHAKLHQELGHTLIGSKFIRTADNRKGIPRSEEDKAKISKAKIGISTTPQTDLIKLKKSINMGAKPFIVSRDGIILGEWTNLSGFCKEFGFNRWNVYTALKEESHVKGYSFRYRD